MTIDDMIYIVTIILLLLISIILLDKLKNKEKNLKMIKKSKKEILDLEAITKNIEENYKPANIRLTSYEEEQESSAIISYDELLLNKDNIMASYDDEFNSTMDIDIKKVSNELNNGDKVRDTKIDISLMSYEKEEAFLKALKQLQIDLAR